jgi:hypothetical protein
MTHLPKYFWYLSTSVPVAYGWSRACGIHFASYVVLPHTAKPLTALLSQRRTP